MKKLIIQIQPKLLKSIDAENMARNFSLKLEDDSQVCGINSLELSVGYDNIDIIVVSNNVNNAWKYINNIFLIKNGEYRVLLTGMIVVSEGRSGWNDYKLLYHYDKSQSIDCIDEA